MSQSRKTSPSVQQNNMYGSTLLPFWLQSRQTREIYMKRPDREHITVRSKVDAGEDNFSYDDAFLAEWEMPDDVGSLVHNELREFVTDWSKAGAALATVLDRLRVFYSKGMNYAYPDKSSHGCFIGHGSPSDSASTPPTSSPIEASSPSVSHYHPSDANEKDCEHAGVTHIEVKPFIEESQHDLVPEGVKAAAHMPLPTEDQGPLPDMAMTNAFDQASWDFFVDVFVKEMEDAKHCINRVQGFGRSIDIRVNEASTYGSMETMTDIAVFGIWWKSVQPLVTKYAARVESLEKPELKYVKFEYEMLRSKSMGLKPNTVLDSRHETYTINAGIL